MNFTALAYRLVLQTFIPDGVLDLDEFRLLMRALFRNDRGKIYLLDNSQLKETFDVFDKNKDGQIDKTEFLFCWTHWIKLIIRPISTFLIVNLQNDFINGTLNGSISSIHQSGSDIIEPINKLLETVKFDAIFHSLDWHPSDHISFFENLAHRPIHSDSPVGAENAQVYDTVIFEGNPPKSQKLWPRHCVQDTWGSELHKDLKVMPEAEKIYKGRNPDVNSYSILCDNHKIKDTTLCDELEIKNTTDVYVCGLTYDDCVGVNAVCDLVIRYRTILLEDCSIGMNLTDTQQIRNIVTENNGVIVNSSQVKAMVEGRDRRAELGYKLAMQLKSNAKKP